MNGHKLLPIFFKRSTLFRILNSSLEANFFYSQSRFEPPKVPFTKGSSVSLVRVISQADIDAFAGLSGDTNPIHVDHEAAVRHPLRFKGCVVHGTLLNSLVSCVLGTLLPGHGTVVLSQQLHYPAPAYAGEAVTVSVTVADVRKLIKVTYQCTVDRCEHPLDTTGHSGTGYVEIHTTGRSNINTANTDTDDSSSEQSSIDKLNSTNTKPSVLKTVIVLYGEAKLKKA